MAKYAINQEGALALKRLSGNLLISANNVLEIVQALEQVTVSLYDDLGVFGDEILSIIRQNKKTLNENREDIVRLAQRVNKQADEVSDFISMGLGNADNIARKNIGDSFESQTSDVTMKDNYKHYLVSTGLVNDVDFGVLDTKTALDMCIAIQETKEMFPDLELPFVGSIQARNIYLKNKLTDMYLDAYRQYNPGVPEEKFLVAVQRQVAQDLQGFDPDSRTIAQSLFVDGSQGFLSEIKASMNGITINEVFGSNYDYFESIRKSEVDTGWKPQNCYSPKATVDHELGHQIAEMVNAHNDVTIQQLYGKFSQLDDDRKSRVLSGYAGTNIHEFIAESWSEYRNNPKCRDCAKIVAKRMLELYDNQPQKMKRLIRRR